MLGITQLDATGIPRSNPYFELKEVDIEPSPMNILYEIQQMCLNALILQTSHVFHSWSFKWWLRFFNDHMSQSCQILHINVLFQENIVFA